MPSVGGVAPAPTSSATATATAAAAAGLAAAQLFGAYDDDSDGGGGGGGAGDREGEGEEDEDEAFFRRSERVRACVLGWSGRFIKPRGWRTRSPGARRGAARLCALSCGSGTAAPARLLFWLQLLRSLNIGLAGGGNAGGGGGSSGGSGVGSGGGLFSTPPASAADLAPSAGAGAGAGSVSARAVAHQPIRRSGGWRGRRMASADSVPTAARQPASQAAAVGDDSDGEEDRAVGAGVGWVKLSAAGGAAAIVEEEEAREWDRARGGGGGGGGGSGDGGDGGDADRDGGCGEGAGGRFTCVQVGV
jgi:hypothetical protein